VVALKVRRRCDIYTVLIFVVLEVVGNLQSKSLIDLVEGALFLQVLGVFLRLDVRVNGAFDLRQVLLAAPSAQISNAL
jgi:hypothetical protein